MSNTTPVSPLSKEQVIEPYVIFDKVGNGEQTVLFVLKDDAYKAMDKWAKIQSISFSDWVQENEYFIPEGYVSYVKRTGQETKFTNSQFIKPEDLFNLYISTLK